MATSRSSSSPIRRGLRPVRSSIRRRRYWVGFAVALVSGLVLGALIERVVIRPVEGAPALNAIIVTLGVLVAPSVFVAPNAFDSVLVFGFTAAVIGGLESPLGALVGGTALGLALSYVSGYGGAELVTLGALVILIAVLMVRPSGLFTRTQARRV